MIRAVDCLEVFRAVLASAGYAVDVRDMPDLGEALIAETPHALVLCLTARWADAKDRVDNAQAALSRLSATHPSPRSWDLYIVAVIEEDRDDLAQREQLESDTRYARKIVAVNVAGRPALAERALLPLLPLRGAAELMPIEPTEAIRVELLEQDVEPHLAAAVLSSFSTTGKVEIP